MDGRGMQVRFKVYELGFRVYGAGEDWARVVHRDTGQLVYGVRCMQRVWVRLSVSSSRSHGPALRVSLLHSCHPTVIAAESQGGGQLGGAPSSIPEPLSR